jgi:hypothetical protein
VQLAAARHGLVGELAVAANIQPALHRYIQDPASKFVSPKLHFEQQVTANGVHCDFTLPGNPKFGPNRSEIAPPDLKSLTSRLNQNSNNSG